jgi:hypothetical protein
LLDQAISVSDAFLEKGEIAKALDRRPASRSAIIPLGSGNGALRLTTARFGQRHLPARNPRRPSRDTHVRITSRDFH